MRNSSPAAGRAPLPRYRSAAEQRDELATFQLIELHSFPASQGRIAGYRIGEDQSGGNGDQSKAPPGPFRGQTKSLAPLHCRLTNRINAPAAINTAIRIPTTSEATQCRRSMASSQRLSALLRCLTRREGCHRLAPSHIEHGASFLSVAFLSH